MIHPKHQTPGVATGLACIALLGMTLLARTAVAAEPKVELLWPNGDPGAKGDRPEDSVLFYLGLHRAGVPAGLHVFEKGPHGIGLGLNLPGTAAWSKLAEAWLRNRGIVPAH